MRKFNNVFLDTGYLAYRMLAPVFDPITLVTSVPEYGRFVYDMMRYSNLPGAEPFKPLNMYPLLRNWTPTTAFDRHYFYQDSWAFRKIYQSRVKQHYDVGSNVIMISQLTAFTKVTFIDIRPLPVKLRNFISLKGDLVAMPFKDNSLSSLSCLHVAEHVGLGRYGDKLDPEGTKKACHELERILAYGGKLYFSLPIGKPRVCFNAHRVHSPAQILEYFKNLELLELSGVDDQGNFIENIDRKILDNADYACGLFVFTKKKKRYDKAH